MTRQDFALVMFAVGFCLLTKPAFALPSAKELLDESAAYFDKGQYRKALAALNPLDIREAFDNSDDMKLAFKIRAVSYSQTGDNVRASETIRELFFIDPSYQFNPFESPKSVVELAQKEKAIIEQKNQHLAAIKSESRQEAPRERANVVDNSKPERILVLEKRPPAVTTLFPFGINHFYLQAPVRGGIYLSLQTLSLATNIAAFWWKQNYLVNFGSARLKEESSKSGFNTAQTIQYIGLGSLLVSYAVSVIDALIRFQSIPTQKVSLNEITS